MPGGSVNGRPFRESSDSYSRTGIPCGNPRRFHSHEVVRMETGSRSAPKQIDGPVEDIETAGEMHLQTLLKKQMDTNITLAEQMKQKKVFSRSIEYQPATNGLSGMVTLDDFQSLGKTDNYIEEMRSFGLTNEEILYKLQSEDTDNSVAAKKSRLSNPDHHKACLEEIDNKIQLKKSTMEKPDTFSNVKPLSRHGMELERTLSKTNDRNHFLYKVLIREKEVTHSTAQNKDDPMNDLPEILAAVSSHKHEKRRQRRKHPKADEYKSVCTLECCVPDMPSCSSCKQCHGGAEDSKSLAESSGKVCLHNSQIQTCTEKPVDYVSKEFAEDSFKEDTKSEMKTDSKKKKGIPVKSTEFTVRTRGVVKVNDVNEKHKEIEETHMTDTEPISAHSNDIRELENVESIPEEAIRGYKLGADDIRKLARFESYSPGKPSNVLYVKNLFPKVTENDLASLFIRYQASNEDRIVFKLLTGRMKGQAFVTFSSIKDATSALELVHGYEYKGKPIIIQYGKKPSN